MNYTLKVTNPRLQSIIEDQFLCSVEVYVEDGIPKVTSELNLRTFLKLVFVNITRVEELEVDFNFITRSNTWYALKMDEDHLSFLERFNIINVYVRNRLEHFAAKYELELSWVG